MPKSMPRPRGSTVVLLVCACAGLAGCKTARPLPTWEEKEPDDAQLAVFEADEPPAADAPTVKESPDAAQASDADPADAPEPVAASQPEASERAALPAPLFGRADKSCGRAAGVGQRAKSFKLKTTSGKPISPAAYRGRVVLLNFWGTWCKPCLEELPEFARLYRRYRSHGLTLLAVATDEDAKAVDEFIRSKKIAAKVAIGGEGAAGEYGDRTFPFSFVIDGEGVIRAAYDGYKPNCLGQLEADIREQLDKL